MGYITDIKFLFRTGAHEAMTEVAANVPPPPVGDQVLSVRHYEAGPPATVAAELTVSVLTRSVL